MLPEGTVEVLEQVLENESRYSDDGEDDSDDDSVFHPSDVSDDDDDDSNDDNDILWETEAKNNTESKNFNLLYPISNCI